MTAHPLFLWIGEDMEIRVLFVCLGNICRSPMAEAVFQNMVNEAGLSKNILVDSAGTGSWHIGEKAHSGTRRVLAQHGISYQGKARQVRAGEWVDQSTYVIAMDMSNINTLKSRFGPHPRLFRLLDFSSQTNVKDVPDPYFQGKFDVVYELVEDGCRGLLQHIRENEGV
jgi:protein-tyrosine phosphatase